LEDVKQAVYNINELEVVNGELWGNVWMSNNLFVFDLEADSVKKKIDLTHLSNLENNYRRHKGLALTNRDQVLNGVAYNAEQKSLLVTGKEWHFVYEVTLLE
jgi:glutamine cyclotransferase